MPAVTETYERNLRSPKFYGHLGAGRERYNPTIIEYYVTISGAAYDGLVCVQEIIGDRMYQQTISGSGYSDQWPNYDYSITYNAWEETTYSG